MTDLFNDLIKEYANCINCGFCETVCPTFSATGGRGIFGPRGRIDLANSVVEEIKDHGQSSLRIENSFYSCLDCYACLQVCPAGVNAGKVSAYLKRIITENDLIEKNQENAIAKMIVKITMKYKNPLGVREKCASWARDIKFDQSSTILYTGNMYQMMAYSKKLENFLKGKDNLMKNGSKIIGSEPALIKLLSNFYDKSIMEKMEKYLKNIVQLLKYSGLKFSYLGNDEPYPGTMIFDLGYVKEFKIYAEEVTKLFHSKNVKRIVVIDPHTYDILKNEYPKYAKDFDFEVIYYLDFLTGLNFKKEDIIVTYHEPCHLKRRLDYDKPLELIHNISVLRLPIHNGKNTMCCGSLDEMLYPKISDKVSELRFKELKETNPEKIITSCPICFANLNKDDSVIDISEFLLEHLSLKKS
ncbi:MAG: (Fe-S)-binding protein [Caldisphaera sp.]